MLKKRRFIKFILFILVPAVLTLWWIFHFPFRPELVCRVIPPEATFISRHIDPALRLNELCESATVTNIISVLGDDGLDLKDIIEDPAIRKLVNIIGSKYIATGFMIRNNGEYSFVMGAWIGGYSQLMRWGLFDRLLIDFDVHKLSNGQRIWVCPCPEIREDYYLSLAVHEGVLAGCISAEQFGVLSVVPRLTRQIPVISMAESWCEPAESWFDDEFKSFVRMPNGISKGYVYLHGVFSEVYDKKIAVKITVDADGDADAFLQKIFHAAVGSSKKSQVPSRILGKSPGALTAVSISSIQSIIGLFPVSGRDLRLWNKLQGLVRKDEKGFLFACGDDYYGRIMHMKVPSIGFMVPLKSEKKGDAAINSIIDELNAAKGWGVIATRDPRNHNIRIINSVRNGPFKKLNAGERPAVAVLDGWLIGLSNVDVLRRILSERDDSESDWGRLYTCHDSAIFGWSDLAETSDLFMKALAGYTLVSLIQGNRNSKRYDTGELKAAVKVLGQLGQFAVWVSPSGGSPVLNAELIF